MKKTFSLVKARAAKKAKHEAKQKNYYYQKNLLKRKWNTDQLSFINCGKYKAILKDCMLSSTDVILMVFEVEGMNYLTSRQVVSSRTQCFVERFVNLELLDTTDESLKVDELLKKYSLENAYDLTVFNHSTRNEKTCMFEHIGETFEMYDYEDHDRVDDDDDNFAARA